jgi:hypothetical protein
VLGGRPESRIATGPSPLNFIVDPIFVPMRVYAQAHIFALTMMEWKPDANAYHKLVDALVGFSMLDKASFRVIYLVQCQPKLVSFMFLPSVCHGKLEGMPFFTASP